MLIFGLTLVAQTSPNLRGIYVSGTDFPVSKQVATQLSTALPSLGADGLLLGIAWDSLETGMGQYDWSTLDQWAGLAVSLGKKVKLSFPAHSPPAWLFQPAPGGGGATPLTFSYASHDALKGCSSETIAAPWDPAFLAQWDAYMAAGAAHLKSTGVYNDISIINLTGINYDSGELHLASQTAQSSGLSCVSDAIATWQSAGYRPSLLLKGWDSITSSLKKSFPDKYFSVAIIASTHPFPQIAEDGSIINFTDGKALSVAQNLPLLTLASQKFAGRMIIQNDTLYPGVTVPDQTVQSSQSLGTLVAFQTNLDFGPSGGASCGPSIQQTVVCTDATFLSELETGIDPLGKSNPLRAQYIEVFAANVDALPNSVLQAHYELIPFNSKNSASYSTAPLAPETIAYGEAASVAGGVVIAPDGPWPPTLGGARLDITDSNGQTRPAPLYYVTSTQLSYLIPAGTAQGHATLKLTTSAGATVNDGFEVQRISPGLFTANASGSGVAAGFWIKVAASGSQTQGYLFDPSQAAGSRNAVPVDLGSSTDRVYLSLYGTGFRGATPTQATATVGGISVPVLGLAAVTAYQGEDVVNIGPLPRLLAGQGEVNIVLSFDGEPANTVTASIR